MYKVPKYDRVSLVIYGTLQGRADAIKFTLIAEWHLPSTSTNHPFINKTLVETDWQHLPYFIGSNSNPDKNVSSAASYCSNCRNNQEKDLSWTHWNKKDHFQNKNNEVRKKLQGTCTTILKNIAMKEQWADENLKVQLADRRFTKAWAVAFRK